MACIADQRSKSGKGESVASAKVDLTFTASGAVQSEIIHFCGVVKRIYVKIPDVTGTPTATLTLVDGDSITLLTKAALVENATTEITDEVWIPLGPITVTLTFTGDPGVSTSTVKILAT